MSTDARFHLHKRLMLLGVLLFCASLVYAFYGSLAAVTDNEILAVAQLRVIDAATKSEEDGSATFISPDGYLLTNFHVVQPAVKDKTRPIVLCLTTDARKPPLCSSMRLNLVAFNEEADLALLKIVAVKVKDRNGWTDFDAFLMEKHLAVNHVRFNRDVTEENINLGENVQILGYPIAGGRSITYTNGVVSGFERREQGEDWLPWLIKTDAKLNPGGSGGAAFDKDNNYIGVPTLVRGGVGNMGYVISLPLVNAFLDSTKLPIAAGGNPAKIFVSATVPTK